MRINWILFYIVANNVDLRWIAYCFSGLILLNMSTSYKIILINSIIAGDRFYFLTYKKIPKCRNWTSNFWLVTIVKKWDSLMTHRNKIAKNG